MPVNDPSDPKPDPRTRVTTTSRLWSAEVAMADADCGGCNSLMDLRGVAYEFSNGRRFANKADPYWPPAE